MEKWVIVMSFLMEHIKVKVGRYYLICRSCGRSFTERTGTIFYDLRSNDDKVLQALVMLAKGMTLRGTAEVLHTKLDTIRYWLQLAAEQAEKVSEHLMRDFHVTKAELDELWTFVKKNRFTKGQFI